MLYELVAEEAHPQADGIFPENLAEQGLQLWDLLLELWDTYEGFLEVG